jgi:hypothetical protein
MELQLIEQTLEAEQGNWVYRFHTSTRGVLVRRVAKDDRSHGTRVQMFDRAQNSFRIAILCGTDVWFQYLDEAVAVVKAQE